MDSRKGFSPHSTIRVAPQRSGPRPAPRRDEIQLRRLSQQDAAGVRGPRVRQSAPAQSRERPGVKRRLMPPVRRPMHHGISQRTRVADRQKDDQGDHRLRHDRGRRPRHGRAVGRQGQLGAAPDPRRAAAARADPVLARRGQRRFRLQGLQARRDRAAPARRAAGNTASSTPASAS